MRLVSETAGIKKLSEIRSEFAAEIQVGYEHKAKPCSACESPGICCRDVHFVNVRITRLEATAIRSALERLGPERLDAVDGRVEETITRYRLTETDGEHKTYACPLFEGGVGCLVHETAKPLPCIAHACYDDPSDLPPDHPLAEREAAIVNLNRRVYGRDVAALPLPVMIARYRR